MIPLVKNYKNNRAKFVDKSEFPNLDRETMRIIGTLLNANNVEQLIDSFEAFPFSFPIRKPYGLNDLFSIEKAFVILRSYKLLTEKVKTLLKEKFKLTLKQDLFLKNLENTLSTFDSAEEFVKNLLAETPTLKTITLPMEKLSKLCDKIKELVIEQEKRFGIVFFKRRSYDAIRELFMTKLLSYAKGLDNAYEPKEKTLIAYEGLKELVDKGEEILKSIVLNETLLAEFPPNDSFAQIRDELYSTIKTIRDLKQELINEEKLLYSNTPNQGNLSRLSFLEVHLAHVDTKDLLESVQSPLEEKEGIRNYAFKLLTNKTSPRKVVLIETLTEKIKQEEEHKSKIEEKIKEMDHTKSETNRQRIVKKLELENENFKQNISALRDFLSSSLGLTVNKKAQNHVNRIKNNNRDN